MSDEALKKFLQILTAMVKLTLWGCFTTVFCIITCEVIVSQKLYMISLANISWVTNSTFLP